jgi:hypothetical protein
MKAGILNLFAITRFGSIGYSQLPEVNAGGRFVAVMRTNSSC